MLLIKELEISGKLVRLIFATRAHHRSPTYSMSVSGHLQLLRCSAVKDSAYELNGNASLRPRAQL